MHGSANYTHVTHGGFVLRVVERVSTSSAHMMQRSVLVVVACQRTQLIVSAVFWPTAWLTVPQQRRFNDNAKQAHHLDDEHHIKWHAES